MASKTPGESADAKANELDDEEVEGEQENSTPWFRKIPLKLIIIAAGALIVLGGGATGAYFFFAGSKEAKPAVAVQLL